MQGLKLQSSIFGEFKEKKNKTKQEISTEATTWVYLILAAGLNVDKFRLDDGKCIWR